MYIFKLSTPTRTLLNTANASFDFDPKIKKQIDPSSNVRKKLVRKKETWARVSMRKNIWCSRCDLSFWCFRYPDVRAHAAPLRDSRRPGGRNRLRSMYQVTRCSGYLQWLANDVNSSIFCEQGHAKFGIPLTSQKSSKVTNRRLGQLGQTNSLTTRAIMECTRFTRKPRKRAIRSEFLPNNLVSRDRSKH